MSVCYSTATATQYTTVTASAVSTSLSRVLSTLPASATTLTSSVCSPQTPGDTTGTLSCRTVTSVSSLDGGTTTVQVPIAVTVTTTSVSPLSTLYSTTCSSSTTTTTQQTSTSTSTATSATSSTTSYSRHRPSTSTATTVIESSVATSAAALAGSSDSDDTALIVGAAVGGGIALVLVVLLGWLLCRRRRLHRKEAGYLHSDKPNQLQGHFDGNAMVRPTPYPFRDHSSSGSCTTHSERTKGHSYRKPVPALNISSQAIHREPDVDPASSFTPQAQTSSATSPSLSVPTKRPSRSLGNIPATSPSLSGVAVLPATELEERPHARTVVSEGTPSASSAWATPSHAVHPPSPPRGPGRPPPLSEKAQIHLHPDRGLTVVPRGAMAKTQAPRSGPPSVRDPAGRGQGQGGVDDRRPESSLRGGGETGGSGAASRSLGAEDGLDACGTGAERQAAAAGMTSEKRRRQEDHEGDQECHWEAEAPPAYCE